MCMDREIKFRAWQKWHEYMFTPDYIDFIIGNIYENPEFRQSSE